jgi:sterol desaturase/sphingolipid hydroxylase (fatty acid hydroxylase superfamily)
MEIFHWLTEQLVAFLATFGLEKQALKAAFYDFGFGPLWDLLRDFYLNPYLMLFTIPLWLVIARVLPAEKPGPHARASVLMDFLYPLFTLPIQAFVVVWFAAQVNHFFELYVPYFDTGLLDGQPILVQAAGAFLIVDFMFYVAHVLKHKVRWFWYFHTIHHSQRYLNPLTTHRNHPLEAFVDLAIKTVPVAVIGGSYPAWALFAFFNGMWGYYIHSSIRLSLGPLNYIFVTPQNHRFHHTINAHEIDRNFGERLAIWDWMFGTLHKDFNAYPATGVSGCEWIEEKGAGPLALVKTWFLQMIYPFRAMAFDVQNAFARARALRRTART